MAEKKIIKVVEDLTKELFEKMGVEVTLKVEEDKKNETVLVNIETEDSAGLLIGSRGETIMAIQTALGMMVKQATGEWARILVDIGDWREKKEGRLKDLAEQAAERAVQTGEGQRLYNLSAADRRVVHLHLSSDDSVETESAGEGRDRYLIVKPK